MTIEDAAKGRPIKPYPYKYNNFNTAKDLEEYIALKLSNRLDIDPDWLKVGNMYHMPFNIYPQTYYSSVPVFPITCYEPKKDHSCLHNPKGIAIGNFSPESWTMAALRNAVEAAKNEIKKQRSTNNEN